MSSVIEHIGIFGAFLEGFISFFSPCVLPLLPLYFGYLSGSLANEKQSRKKSVIFTIMFLVGMFTALLLLNLSITWISGFFKGAGIWFMRIGGLLIVVLGVIQLGLLRLPFLERTLHIRYDFSGKTMSALLAFIMGFTFSFSWTPCIGPALASILIMAGSMESVFASIGLVACYALGFGLPFLILSFFSKQAVAFFRHHETLMQVIVKVGAIILIVMGLAMMGGLLGAVGNANSAPDDDSLSEDVARAPEFTLFDQNGTPYDSADLEGKVVYMNFWGTWCPICVEELDEIQKLYDTYRDSEEVAILTFVWPNSSKETDNQGIQQFLDEHGYDFPVLFDESGELFYRYGITAYPTTFFIDKKQRVYGYVSGKIAFDRIDELFAEIAAEE